MRTLDMAVLAEIGDHIRRAAEWEIQLTPKDFTVEDGCVLIDGMDAGEWIDAMTMD